MPLLRTLFQQLPTPWQQGLLRRYLVNEIRHGRRVAEGEILYLPNLVHVGDIVWDIGANAGEYTFQLSRLVGVDGQVHPFEPLSYNFGTLLATINRARVAQRHRSSTCLVGLSRFCAHAYAGSARAFPGDLRGLG